MNLRQYRQWRQQEPKAVPVPKKRKQKPRSTHTLPLEERELFITPHAAARWRRRVSQEDYAYFSIKVIVTKALREGRYAVHPPPWADDHRHAAQPYGGKIPRPHQRAVNRLGAPRGSLYAWDSGGEVCVVLEDRYPLLVVKTILERKP